MKWRFNAEEMNLIFLMAWPEKISAFQKLSSIYPNGVKNVLKWRHGIGIMAEKQKKKLEEQNIWGTDEFEFAVMVMLLFKKKISIIKNNEYIVSYFVSNDIVSSLTFLNEINEYEVRSYSDKKRWIEDIERDVTDHKEEENTVVEFLGMDAGENDISQTWNIRNINTETIFELLRK